jgi:phage/plasmid-associated DNA primase
VSNPKHFLGNFNAHLANCLFLFVDEAFWAGDKSSDGILKALITEDTLNIERKGQDVIKMANLIFLMMASNNDWVVPAGLEARRHCVLDVSESRMQDKAYFAAIQEQMDNGGREAFMYDLLHTDLSIADIRTVPKTAALLEQKIYSMTPIQQFWYNRLRDGSLDETATWKEAVPTAELYSMYIKESQLIGEKRRSRETEFGMQLKKLVPWCVKKKRVISAKAWGGGTEEKRLWCYFFPPLDECRKHFAAQLQEPGLDWEDEEGIVEDMNAPDSKTPASTTDRTSPAADAFNF